MAKITRIKASDPGKTPEEPLADTQTVKKVKVGKDSSKAKKTAKTASKAVKTTKKPVKTDKKAEKAEKEGNYFKNSWLELRQVRWPSRKATWKMVAAVLVYTGLFIAIIMLLDALFTWLFGLILG